MKSLIISLLFLNFSIASFAQSPPRIRVPGGAQTQTQAQKEQTAKDKLFATQGVFKPGMNFIKGTKYYSADNRYFFTFQEDGNFVIYKVATGKALWYTHTNGKAVKKCQFQGDGNLVLSDYNGKPVWDAWTDQNNRKSTSYVFEADVFSDGTVPLYMQMQSDGNLVIYGPFSKSKLGNVIFFSNSFERN